MRILCSIAAISAVALTSALAAETAYKLNCADPQSNGESKMCAQREFERADKDLNAAYAEALAYARELDGYDRENPTPGRPNLEQLLRKAEDAWVAFRNADCDLHYNVYYGGSMARLADLICMTDMTKARAQELRTIANGGEEPPPPQQ